MSEIWLILEYVNWWLPVLAFSSPIIWAIVYHNWYKYYKERKEAESWERISKFFNEHQEQYPDAAASFGMARFWASPGGYNLMHKIKTVEYTQATKV